MSITFTCSSCHRSITVGDQLAGKRGKCKSCGSVIKVPEPVVAATSGLRLEDLYGLEDAPAVSARAKQTSGRGPFQISTPMPSRAPIPGAGKAKRTKSGSGGGPWGVVIRRAACGCLFASLVISRLLRLIPSEYQTNQVLVFFIFATICMIGVGVLLSVVSFVGATVSFIMGNTRAFASESTGELAGWLVACLVSLAAVVAYGYASTHPASNLAQSFRPGGGAPGAFPARLPFPGAGAGAAPWPAPGFPAPSDFRVTLSNGRFMQNTGPIGTARPGVEISVDYNIDAGELAGPEQFVLVIKSSKGLGELDNLHELRFRRSGTIHAASFMASPAEGPYEAWVEIASMPGLMAQRKQVSNTIPLQFLDVPVRDPAAEARAALDAQLRKMANPPPMPQIGRGFRPPTQPMPRGGRFGPGPR
ncbi:MAG: hypothetical protein ACLQIB_04930 [Isosphaeraceae bacterium]